MDSFDFIKIINEISTLDSYLNFGNENLRKFNQGLITELNISIEKLRQLENIPSEISDDEIILQVEIMEFSDEIFFVENHEENLRLSISSTLEGIETSHEYSNLFYATIVIMLYSCVERGLIKLCDLQEVKIGLGVIPQARAFLDNKLGYRIDHMVWKELKFVRWLRNTIVHSGMSFSLDFSLGEIAYDSYGEDALVVAQPELIEYLKSKKVYMKEAGLISLNLDYCKYLIEFFHNFFLKIQALDRSSKASK